MPIVHPGNEAVERLWSLIYAQMQIDPVRLARLVEEVVSSNDVAELDQRTRKLLQDAERALRLRTGERTGAPISEDAQARIAALEVDPLSFVDRGFDFIGDALMDETSPEAIRGVLQQLDDSLRGAETIYVGGSGSLILQGMIRRNTNDIDVVDEVPKAIRENHKLLADLFSMYRLQLAHMQSHYLPRGWQSRVRRVGAFKYLSVFLVDPLDIFVGKLFSKRIKDRDDLRVLKRTLNEAAIRTRFLESADDLMADEFMRPNAESNWKTLFGDALPRV